MSQVNYTPENTPGTLYIKSGYSLSVAELIIQLQEHFGTDVDLASLDIQSEKIHTRCITYDLYDGSDYDDYLIITKL